MISRGTTPWTALRGASLALRGPRASRNRNPEQQPLAPDGESWTALREFISYEDFLRERRGAGTAAYEQMRFGATRVVLGGHQISGALSVPGDHSGRGRWDSYPVNGRAGVLALARPGAPPGRPVLKASKTMADHNRSTLPSMATSTPASTPAQQPRRLSLFGPPIGVLEVFAKEMAFIYQAPFLALQAAVELGTELDEPTTAEASATPTQQPPASPAAPTAERPKPAIGTGLDWQTARDRLVAIRRQGESFTSLRDLAARVGCSEGLIRKAIKQDVGLRAWTAESKRTRRTAPAATGLERAIHRTPQRREEAPELATVEADETDDADVLLQRLIDAASPAERARLHAMPEEQRMSLLRLMRDQDEDRDERRLRKRA